MATPHMIPYIGTIMATRSLYLPKTEKAIRENFPGNDNIEMRKQLRREAYSGWIPNYSEVAFTARGEVALAEVVQVHRAEMQELGLADSDGYPIHSMGPDENGYP